MLTKKEGTINGIVYDYTVYHNGRYRLYPTLVDLKGLIRKIIESGSTTVSDLILFISMIKKINKLNLMTICSIWNAETSLKKVL